MNLALSGISITSYRRNRAVTIYDYAGNRRVKTTEKSISEEK
jgi:hypothetical protein